MDVIEGLTPDIIFTVVWWIFRRVAAWSWLFVKAELLESINFSKDVFQWESWDVYFVKRVWISWVRGKFSLGGFKQSVILLLGRGIYLLPQIIRPKQSINNLIQPPSRILQTLKLLLLLNNRLFLIHIHPIYRKSLFLILTFCFDINNSLHR